MLDEPELHLGDDIVVPDLGGWRRARLTEVPDTAYFTLAPDFCAEVLSPSTARVDRTVKMDIYARERVGHVWLLDPTARTLEAFRFERGAWIEVGRWSGDARARIEPFEAVELPLRALWSL